MRRDLTMNEIRQLHDLVYNATIFELAETIYTQHRDIELELLIALIQEKQKEESQDG